MFDGNVRLLSATRTMQWSKPVKKCIEGNTDVRTTVHQPSKRLCPALTPKRNTIGHESPSPELNLKINAFQPQTFKRS